MRKNAFTLAEVLITLVIIGVIAAMTIPTLMGNTNNQELTTKQKKTISAINQAVKLDQALYGNNPAMTANWNGDWDGASNKLKQGLMNHLSVIDDNVDCCNNCFQTADGLIYSIGAGASFNGEYFSPDIEVFVNVKKGSDGCFQGGNAFFTSMMSVGNLAAYVPFCAPHVPQEAFMAEECIYKFPY